MNHALASLAKQHRAELELRGIEVRPEANMILWNNTAYRLKPYSSTAICWREMRRIINKAKEAEQADALRNQTSLLDSLEKGGA